MLFRVHAVRLLRLIDLPNSSKRFAKYSYQLRYTHSLLFLDAISLVRCGFPQSVRLNFRAGRVRTKTQVEIFG